MQDRWVVTFITARGEFRFWEDYRDRSIQMAREMMALGALGAEVYDTRRSVVAWAKGQKTSDN